MNKLWTAPEIAALQATIDKGLHPCRVQGLARSRDSIVSKATELGWRPIPRGRPKTPVNAEDVRMSDGFIRQCSAQFARDGFAVLGARLGPVLETVLGARL